MESLGGEAGLNGGADGGGEDEELAPGSWRGVGIVVVEEE